MEIHQGLVEIDKVGDIRGVKGVVNRRLIEGNIRRAALYIKSRVSGGAIRFVPSKPAA